MTVADHEKTTVVPKYSSTFPRGLLRPNKNNRPSPTTVGGKTRGRMKIPSRRLLILLFIPAIQRAAATPNTKVIAVAVSAVFSEMRIGERSSVAVIAIAWSSILLEWQHAPVWSSAPT